VDSSILAIVGPTASGKTTWALELARRQDAEVISVDSRQVYRKLSVGTAKPSGSWSNAIYQVEGVPYHLVDILDPAERFSAAAFVDQAGEKIREIRERGRTPVLAGGTGLYFKALTEGLAALPPSDRILRAELKERADRHGRATLHEDLRAVDPVAAGRIPPNNIARVVRALEVFRLTGRPISLWHAEHQASRAPAYELRYVGVDCDREELGRRIAERGRRMLAGGMIEETQRLLADGYSENCAALSGLGYPRVVAFLKNQMRRDELLAAIVQDTCQYAKRQRTWFRNQMKVQWKKSLP